MRAEITAYDEQGKPLRVELDDGFCQTCAPYDEAEHGWINEQLDPRDFVAVRIGRDTEYLINALNASRREVFTLKQQLQMWQKAAGYT